MKKIIRNSALLAVLVLSACQWGGSEKNTEKQNDAFVTQVEPPKTDGTVGMLLPDFTELVAREGGAVVHIQTIPEDNKGSDMGEDAFADLFRRMLPMDPYQDDRNTANFGSGVIISSDGYLLTNAHVVSSAHTIRVTLNDKREYPAKLIGKDQKSDIALLKIEADDLPVAKIGNPNELKSGEWVAAIGAPFGFDNSVTAGIVSAKNRSLPYEQYTPFIQTDVAVNPGNSGGPLFNLKGQVIGINSQIYSRSGGFMGISFAIPIDIAMNVAEQLKTTGTVRRGQLGVIIQEVNYNLAQSFGLDKPTGALVSQVLPNSPAKKGGLQAGDIIRSVNGEEVRSSNHLPMTIGAMAPGKEVVLGVWRKGETIELKVTLASAGEDNNMPYNKYEPESSRIDTFEFPEAGMTISVENNYNGNRLVIRQAHGAAARAGLMRGDVIAEVGGIPVHNQEEFKQAMSAAGQNIPLLILRKGNALFVALVLSKP